MRRIWALLRTVSTVREMISSCGIGLPNKLRAYVLQDEGLRHGIKAVEQDGAGGRHIVAEMSFTALGRGDYVIELTATAGSVTERKLLAVRVR